MGCCHSPSKSIILKNTRKADFRDVYETGQKLGEGTFGVVFECTKKKPTEDDKDPHKVYAVKMLEYQSSWLGQMSRSQNIQWEMFQQEFEMLRRMDHPNVIRLHDIFLDSNFLYFVMDKYATSLISAVLPLLQKGKKVMPHCCIGEITSQMLKSIVYLHDQNIVHRDVKADNYLVDRETFKGVEFTVVLTDLSTARHLEDGVFLKDMLGTMQYWAPEVVARSYTHKVDCFAIGVILWCMLIMKFPFNNVQETYTKKLTHRADKMSPEEYDLCLHLLEKNPNNRFTARKASEHPWVKESVEKHRHMVQREAQKEGHRRNSKGSDDSSWVKGENTVAKQSPEDSSVSTATSTTPGGKHPPGVGDESESPESAEDAACIGFGNLKKAVPAEVIAHRKQLLDDAKAAFDRGERVAISFDDTVKEQQQDQQDDGLHVTRDRQRRGEAKTYTWWARERAQEKKVPDVDTECTASGTTNSLMDTDPAVEQAGDIALTEPTSVEELREQLSTFGVDTSTFATGEAKSLEQLFNELDSLECRMLLRNDTVVRVVDLTVLRLRSPSGKYLVEVSQSFADGRTRPVHRLPAVMRKAGGSGIDTARSEVERLIAEELKSTPDVVNAKINLQACAQDSVSYKQKSASYPGLETVYRKTFFSAFPNKHASSEKLQKLGLMSESAFTTGVENGGSISWEWWTADKCELHKIPVHVHLPEPPEMEGFVPAVPESGASWTDDSLTALLEKHGVNTKLFGVGTARSISEFVAETNTGETRLFFKGAEMRRYLEILIVKIKNTFGAYLIETGHSFGKGQSRARNAFPATKVRPFEDKVWAVRRLLREVDIPFASSQIRFGPRRVEKTGSPSYPGVTTVYLKQVVEVELHDIDVANLNDEGMGNEKWFRHKAKSGGTSGRRTSRTSGLDEPQS